MQSGFIVDQQFFIGFARQWASKSSEAFLRKRVVIDDRSPVRFRPVTVRNLDAWYTAFSVKPGD